MLQKSFKPILAFLAGGMFILALAATGTDTKKSPGSAVNKSLSSMHFVGEILLTGANFCPQGFVPCDGRLLEINDNAALYALLGPDYGGNGTTNFAVPDLRGRTTVGTGTGPGLPKVDRTQKTGGDIVAGGQTGVDNQPYLGLTYCICQYGTFPAPN